MELIAAQRRRCAESPCGEKGLESMFAEGQDHTVSLEAYCSWLVSHLSATLLQCLCILFWHFQVWGNGCLHKITIYEAIESSQIWGWLNTLVCHNCSLVWYWKGTSLVNKYGYYPCGLSACSLLDGKIKC